MTGIPLIIHQIWLDKTTDANLTPPAKYLTEKYTIGIAKTNPEFEYRFWNMEAVKHLFEDSRLQKWKNFYFNLNDHIEMCDFVRYAIMYIHGGVYIDCDISAVVSLKGLVSKYSELMLVPNLTQCGVTLRNPAMTVPAAISNSVIGSVPDHKFWPELMDYIMYRYDESIPVLNSTGPVALGNFAQLMFYSIDDRPQWYIESRLVLWEEVKDPKDWIQYLHNNRFMGSWWQLDPKIIAKVILFNIRNSSFNTAILIIVILILLILVIMYHPSTSVGNHIEQYIRGSFNINVSSSMLWLYLGISIFICGVVVTALAHLCAVKKGGIPEMGDRISNIGFIIIGVGGLLGLRSILRR